VSLRAPIAVPVEIRADARAGARRAFRLAWNIGEDGVRLCGDLPFELGRLVEARLLLPGGEALALRAHVTAGNCDREPSDRNADRTGDPAAGDDAGELSFVDPPSDARAALRRYVIERLELPV
jgi:hypothetical protein